ncbi:ARF-GAP domain 4 [Striga asiatica]|uniref:ARF-GAP domain 4 n=1 Tax=Striga asiatica TaxID=4170 RepID=A0A5A7Q752_STRAF|nr:ARF-GAP domain 4 [Striga asiatica]
MGNAATIGSCFRPPNPPAAAVTLIPYGGGAATTLAGKHLAGEIMFEFPDRMVCPADSFFVGRPAPALSIGDELVPGRTYFLLPIDLFGPVLSPSSMAALRPAGQGRAGFKGCPFEYGKGPDGRVLIRVVPEFIAWLINGESENSDCGGGGSGSPLCSTPELQKHYDQLVGFRDRVNWSPKLETISECKIIRFSPCRFMGLQWKKEETDGCCRPSVCHCSPPLPLFRPLSPNTVAVVRHGDDVFTPSVMPYAVVVLMSPPSSIRRSPPSNSSEYDSQTLTDYSCHMPDRDCRDPSRCRRRWSSVLPPLISPPLTSSTVKRRHTPAAVILVVLTSIRRSRCSTQQELDSH